MTATLLDSTILYACLYASLFVCAGGIVYRIISWFFITTGPGADAPSPAARFIAAIRSATASIFSPRIFRLIRAVLFDIPFQTGIARTSMSRWFMHICLFWGFTLLLLMHALDELITRKMFPEYYSTLDPFQLLRNVFGVMVAAGVCIALWRRIRHGGPMLATRHADRYAVALLAVIIVSGFALESAKMISESVFGRMMKDFYAGEAAGDETALKAYWSEEYGTSFRGATFKVTPALLARGKAVNEMSCSSCHSPARSAFVSLPLAKLMRAPAARLEQARAEMILYYVHVLACFLGLALLPFTKFLHLITDPIAILVGALSDRKNANRTAAIPRRAMELDACTSCGTCSRHCSVEPVFRMMGNRHILPMDKLRDVRTMAGRGRDDRDLAAISEGAFICTSCFRCTEVCPAGINLQDQWLSSRELLAEKGHPSPHRWIKEFNASEWSDRMKKKESSWKEIDTIRGKYYNLTDDSDVFAPCIQCQTCTNVCPVVAARTDPEDAVDITPQKIMNLLRLGLNDLAMGSRMVWDCTTCYQCQENCPQGIRVTEIIYELRNRAYDHFKTIDRKHKGSDEEHEKK